MMLLLRNSFDGRWVERKISKHFVGFSLMQFESFVLAGGGVQLGKLRRGQEMGLCGLGVNNRVIWPQ